jgi:hypothetical protein
LFKLVALLNYETQNLLARHPQWCAFLFFCAEEFLGVKNDAIRLRRRDSITRGLVTLAVKIWLTDFSIHVYISRAWAII